MKTSNKLIIILLFGIFIGFTHVTATGVHIPTVSEGLLETEGCYIGAYLGGNQGSNGAAYVNYYKTSNGNPYETQILDQPGQYGEKYDSDYAKMLSSIDTGIDTFRKGVESLKSGAGEKQLLFSRYYSLWFYPDNDYGKIKYTQSPPLDVWVEKVLQKGGVPVIVLDPYNLKNGSGYLDLSVTNSGQKTGVAVMTEIARKCDALSRKYAGSKGQPATILICFGLEFNCHKEVNPTSDDTVDNDHKRAWRQMFRDAYTVVHANANPSVQMVWAGNVAQSKNDRIYYWPGTDSSGNQMSDDYVDWVGMTWYPWNDGPKTLDKLSGFYEYYAKERRHPMIFMETSADGNGIPADELSLKENHVTYLYNPDTLKRYPNIKGIIWFDVIKGEENTQNQLVTKNFLIPDGTWNNHNKSQSVPGTLSSASNPGATMESRYPDAVADSYFISPASSLSAEFDMVINPGSYTVTCTDASIGSGISSWTWDVNADKKPEYSTRNITHRYTAPGRYPITLTVSNGEQTHSHTEICTLSAEKPSYISIGSLPGKAEIWVDDSRIGTTTMNQMTRYLVPGGTHTVTLKKNGYLPWTGSYTLKWPQVRYFGQVKLQKAPGLFGE